MTEHYYTVGVHGAPTPETAPHGFFYVADGDWTEQVRYATGALVLTNEQSVWWPAPAPPTEQAPAPEPVKRWDVRWCERLTANVLTIDELRAGAVDLQVAADALNALDRDGVAWGPGRPMAELPETGRVIVLLTAEHGKGDEFYAYSAEVAHKFIGRVRCWWPLPLPGEATT